MSLSISPHHYSSALARGGGPESAAPLVPVLNTIMPRGGQRGTDLELTLAGDRLADAQEIVRKIKEWSEGRDQYSEAEAQQIVIIKAMLQDLKKMVREL